MHIWHFFCTFAADLNVNWQNMRKKIYIWVLLLLAMPLVAAPKYTVVIDAGHGGKDPGAVGILSKEKDLNLTLALKTGKMISEQFPDVKVVYTRSTDVFIPLQTRADIANKNNANLFISIHTNSAESKAAAGVETFILGTEKMEKNLDVAMRENAVMKLEADYKTTYHGFDPNSIDSYIMFELMQNAYMDQSLQFATMVQNQFVGKLNRGDRGVRQAAFWVLLKTACPSILFEMGFISNPEEEEFLNQEESMNKMAKALVNAFETYTKRTRVLPKDEPKEEPKVEQKKEEPKAETQPKVEPQKETPVPEINVEPAPEPVTYYAVQLCASKTPLAADDARLKGQICEFIKAGEWYKYYTAASTDKAEVQEKQKELKPLFPDCWIITFSK